MLRLTSQFGIDIISSLSHYNVQNKMFLCHQDQMPIKRRQRNNIFSLSALPSGANHKNVIYRRIFLSKTGHKFFNNSRFIFVFIDSLKAVQTREPTLPLRKQNCMKENNMRRNFKRLKQDRRSRFAIFVLFWLRFRRISKGIFRNNVLFQF